ncbi:hypothetical protein ACFLQI_03300 [Candidatus Undinarchaeota archaeon]
MQSKKESMKKLEKALDGGKVDLEMLPVLEKINQIGDYHTTSSCSGRVNLFEVKGFGAKGTLNSLGKWHEGVAESEFLPAVDKHKANELWLKVEPPILHVVCSDFESAKKLLSAAYAAGFKHSSIKSGGMSFMVEITSTERMELPLGKGGKVLVDEDYLKFVLKMSNEKLKKSKEKLKRFVKELASFESEEVKITEEQLRNALNKVSLQILPSEANKRTSSKKK